MLFNRTNASIRKQAKQQASNAVEKSNCSAKVLFESELAVKAWLLAYRPNGAQGYYRCRWCNGWHLTRK